MAEKRITRPAVLVPLSFGGLMLLAALGVCAHDIAREAGGGSGLKPLGTVWFELSPGSLNLTQAVIERYLWTGLWDHVVFPLLAWPAVLVLGIPGIALVILGWLLARGPRPNRPSSAGPGGR